MTPPIDLHQYQDPLTIQRVLHNARTVAIVGLSKNQLRASYFVGYYLRRHGYHVIPVNPRESEILGETCYASLTEIPVPVDIVDVFRAPDALPGIARDIDNPLDLAHFARAGSRTRAGLLLAENAGALSRV